VKAFPHTLVDNALETCVTLERGVLGQRRDDLVGCAGRLVGARERETARGLRQVLEATRAALLAGAAHYVLAVKFNGRPEQDETVRRWARETAAKLGRYLRATEAPTKRAS
jgi:hypothetical protein